MQGDLICKDNVILLQRLQASGVYVTTPDGSRCSNFLKGYQLWASACDLQVPIYRFRTELRGF